MPLKITAIVKTFLRNSIVSKNIKNFQNKKRQSTVMFLRAPKHFKAGKQFINYFRGVGRVTHKSCRLNTRVLLLLSSKQLYSLYYTYLLKNSLPEFKVNRVTYRFNLILCV